jgi:hypothetical protein
MVYEPEPGDIFLTRIGGFVGGAISLGQSLVALSPSVYTHSGVVLDHGFVIAAQPAGARIDPIESILDDRPLAFLPVPAWAEDRRKAIVATARALEGRPYGFEDYLWIGLSRLGIRPGWLRNKVATDERLICSAFADRVWMLNGIRLFDDGRLLGAVTPGNLSTRGWVYHADTGPFGG